MTRFFRTSITALSIFMAVFSLAVSTAQAARLTYNGSEYTNLCGSGTEASFNSCGSNCNTSTGSCSFSTNSVVRYECDGRQTECRQNESAFSSFQSVGTPSCGKTVQIDVFDKNCRDTNGQWTCNDSNLKDYIVWYSGDCTSTPPQSDSCQAHEPINTQFRESGESTWISGDSMNSKNMQVGDRVDVNCFAKNGTDLLPGAQIVITNPNSSTETKSGAELRNYQISQAGTYRFQCTSTTLANCQNTDSFRVGNTPVEQHESACTLFDITSGNNQTVPTTVRFNVAGTDSLGNIQRYRVYFGDGTKSEGTDREFSHTYEVSGKFYARADVKDSKGRWITSSACEETVTVQSRSIESHKSDCSDLYILKGNHERAPSTVEFKVSGYDNKGDIQKYKLDFGNGIVKENSGQVFEQIYSQPGTYKVRAYVQDSHGEWKGGDDSCADTVYIETAPITKQPDTGTPTGLTLFALTSGVIGAVALMRRHALLKA